MVIETNTHSNNISCLKDAMEIKEKQDLIEIANRVNKPILRTIDSVLFIIDGVVAYYWGEEVKEKNGNLKDFKVVNNSMGENKMIRDIGEIFNFNDTNEIPKALKDYIEAGGYFVSQQGLIFVKMEEK